MQRKSAQLLSGWSDDGKTAIKKRKSREEFQEEEVPKFLECEESGSRAAKREQTWRCEGPGDLRVWRETDGTKPPEFGPGFEEHWGAVSTGESYERQTEPEVERQDWWGDVR